MTDKDDTTAHIDAAAAILNLPITPERKENVAAFVNVARQMAARVEESGAGRTTEAAPVFRPREQS